MSGKEIYDIYKSCYGYSIEWQDLSEENQDLWEGIANCIELFSMRLESNNV